MFIHGGKNTLTKVNRHIVFLSKICQFLSYHCLFLIWSKANLHSVPCLKGHYNKNCLHLYLLLKVLPQCHLEIFLMFSAQRMTYVWYELRVEAPVVPYSALLQRGSEQKIWVLNDNTLSKFNKCKQTLL